jgi:ribonuclease HII
LQNGPTWEAVLSYLDAGQIIVGIDEVGRGAWAGPVVAGAVILPSRSQIEGLNDSKLVTPKRRLELDRVIRRQAVAVGLGWVSAAEIDAEGLSWAVQQSGLRALAALEATFDLVILDGKHNYLAGHHPSITLIKADQLVVPVAAGSVVAKVARDRYMAGLARRHPGYGLEQHKGYGTKAHAAALASLGPTSIHRRTWGPFKESRHVD